ncbi:MAG: hypothetical protein ABSG03_28905 [Bryobacteraceae bacterium]|jgi:hypothetical protein
MHYGSLRRAASARLTGVKGLAIAMCAWSALSVTAWGQLDTGGSVGVTVTDPSGAGIPGAALTLKESSFGLIVSTQGFR